MIEIVCRTPKQLLILECTQYPTIEALSITAATMIRAGNPIILKWAEGVVFSYSQLPPTTESLMKEFLEGRVYWTNVVFSLMPEFKSSIRVGTIDIPVIDVSPNPVLRAACGWMKLEGIPSNNLKNNEHG